MEPQSSMWFPCASAAQWNRMVPWQIHAWVPQVLGQSEHGSACGPIVEFPKMRMWACTGSIGRTNWYDQFRSNARSLQYRQPFEIGCKMTRTLPHAFFTLGP